MAILLSFSLTIPVIAQTKGNGTITKKSYNLEQFTGVEVSGARNVILIQGDGFTVVVETDENIQDLVTLKVKNDVLKFGFSETNIRKYSELNFYVTAPVFDLILASGATEVAGADKLSGDKLKIVASGASEVLLKVDYNSLYVKQSGASEVSLSGKVKSSVVETSGASEFYGKALATNSSVVTASGASECFVNAFKSLTYLSSGTSEVKFVKNPEMVLVKKVGDSEVVVKTKNTYTFTQYDEPDTTQINMGFVDVEVIEGDTTYVSVGRHTLVVSDEGDVKWQRKKRTKFNGNWGGIDIGLNGYVTPDFDMSFDKADNYLDLRMEKSINVNVNIYEQNINLSKDNNNMGLITGIGLTINNYRFSNSTYLNPDESSIEGYYMEGINIRKSKLTACYISVPLFFEIQSKHQLRTRQFHFAVGAIVSARLSTHTKVYFDESGKIYDMVDPATGNVIGTSESPTGSGRNIVKDHDSFHLAPFKCDASVRFGYGIINLYATYSMNTLFQKDRGPELYPFSAGITLVSW